MTEESPNLAACSTFQLLYLLLKDGFECCLKSILKQTIPYTLGGKKIFHLKFEQRLVHHYYIWALLAAATHGQEVIHFQINAYYRALVEGKEYILRQDYNWKHITSTCWVAGLVSCWVSGGVVSKLSSM